MVLSEVVKNYLNGFFEDPEKYQNECFETIPPEVLCAIESFVNTLKQNYEKRNKNFNYFGLLIVLGYMLKSNLYKAELEECLKIDCNYNEIQKDEICKTQIIGIPTNLVDSLKNKKGFITYDEFLKRYSFKSNRNRSATCEEILKDFNINFNIKHSCVGYTCMSIQCYNCFREVYFGEE